MRDPEGTIEFRGNLVVRKLSPNATATSFLQAPLAAKLVNDEKLIPFEFTATDIVESPRLPFVSYPFEWCEAQLYLAGQHTLDISREILDSGYELKDASAWNIIFQGNRPVFCDHLSFQPIATSQWWAFGQFTRHFLLPLVVSRQRGLKPHQIYATYRDGISPEIARQILGFKRYLTRYWPLMLNVGGNSNSEVASQVNGKRLHGSLYSFSKALLDGSKPAERGSHWASYTETRQHYTDDASSEKYKKVAEWLLNIKPNWVIDLGCNTGEYTLLASKEGANVICIDLDHDSIQKIVLSCCNAANIHPLVTNLGDMVGGRGWCGDEFPSLMTRLHQQGDVLLMLALIHHLTISEGISIRKVAQMAAHITRDFLIVEMLDETDPMVLHLCRQRKRNPKDFSIISQLAAFANHFSTLASFSISNTVRTLCLLKKI